MEVVGVYNAAINALAPSGERFCCTSKVYVVRNINKVYLSLNVLRGLRIVGINFPEAGTSLNQHQCNQCVVAAAAASHDCGCPERKPPPGPPTHLPFASSVANVQEMKAWLLDRYAASAFNKCPNQPLPQMDGPPVEKHLVEDAIPR